MSRHDPAIVGTYSNLPATVVDGTEPKPSKNTRR